MKCKIFLSTNGYLTKLGGPVISLEDTINVFLKKTKIKNPVIVQSQSSDSISTYTTTTIFY